MPRRSDIDVPTLQRVIAFPVHATIPNDYRAVSEAYAEPRLLSFDTAPGEQIGALASDLAGLPVPSTKKSRKFSLFG